MAITQERILILLEAAEDFMGLAVSFQSLVNSESFAVRAGQQSAADALSSIQLSSNNLAMIPAALIIQRERLEYDKTSRMNVRSRQRKAAQRLASGILPRQSNPSLRSRAELFAALRPTPDIRASRLAPVDQARANLASSYLNDKDLAQSARRVVEQRSAVRTGTRTASVDDGELYNMNDLPVDTPERIARFDAMAKQELARQVAQDNMDRWHAEQAADRAGADRAQTKITLNPNKPPVPGELYVSPEAYAAAQEAEDGFDDGLMESGDDGATGGE